MPLLVGTHFLTESKDESKAIKYLSQSLCWKVNPKAAYQLAYIYETRLRQHLRTKEIDQKMRRGKSKDKHSRKTCCSDLMHAQQEELKQMICWYQVAARMEDGRAMNQIGSFFIDFNHLLFTGVKLEKTPEQFLIASKELKIPQALNTLIRLYRKRKKYSQLVILLEEKLSQSLNSSEVALMELILTMLNHGDYAG